MNDAMTMHRPQRRSRRAAFLYLSAVLAIIAGLLAMHSLSLEDTQTGTVVSTVSVEPGSDAVGTAASIDAHDPLSCAGQLCDAPHVIAASTCLLALLTLLILLLPPTSRWAEFLARLRRRFLTVRAAASEPTWSGPSLISLSISRT